LAAGRKKIERKNAVPDSSTTAPLSSLDPGLLFSTTVAFLPKTPKPGLFRSWPLGKIFKISPSYLKKTTRSLSPWSPLHDLYPFDHKKNRLPSKKRQRQTTTTTTTTTTGSCLIRPQKGE